MPLRAASGSGGLLDGEAFVSCGCLLCSPGAPWSAAGHRLFVGVLVLRGSQLSGWDAGGRRAGHQAVEREGGPGLDHVDPPDGDQEAGCSAGLLGVKREVAQEPVGSSRPCRMRADDGDQTALLPRLQETKMGNGSWMIVTRQEIQEGEFRKGIKEQN